MAGKLTGPPGWTPDSSMAPPSLTWQERDGFRPSTMGKKFGDTQGGEALKPGAFEETNRATRAKAKEFVSEEDAREFLGASAQEPAEKPPRAAWAEAESNLFNAAEAGTTGFYKSNKEKLATSDLVLSLLSQITGSPDQRRKPAFLRQITTTHAQKK